MYLQYLPWIIMALEAFIILPLAIFVSGKVFKSEKKGLKLIYCIGIGTLSYLVWLLGYTFINPIVGFVIFVLVLGGLLIKALSLSIPKALIIVLLALLFIFLGVKVQDLFLQKMLLGNASENISGILPEDRLDKKTLVSNSEEICKSINLEELSKVIGVTVTLTIPNNIYYLNPGCTFAKSSQEYLFSLDQMTQQAVDEQNKDFESKNLPIPGVSPGHRYLFEKHDEVQPGSDLIITSEGDPLFFRYSNNGEHYSVHNISLGKDKVLNLAKYLVGGK